MPLLKLSKRLRTEAHCCPTLDAFLYRAKQSLHLATDRPHALREAIIDHQKVADLFKQFKKTENPVYKAELVAMVAKELTLHATSEQETFYKILEQFEESEGEAHHGEK